MSDDELQDLVASYHEAGHVVVAFHLNCSDLEAALGKSPFAKQSGADWVFSRNASKEDILAVCGAGTAAELIVYGTEKQRDPILRKASRDASKLLDELNSVLPPGPDPEDLDELFTMGIRLATECLQSELARKDLQSVQTALLLKRHLNDGEIRALCTKEGSLQELDRGRGINGSG